MVQKCVNASQEESRAQVIMFRYVRDCTFFFSSTDIALASLRNIALPQRSSRKLVNWWYFHLRKAQAASWNSLSVQLLSASNNGLTEMQAITRQNSQRSQAVDKIIPITL